ncbi:MAG: adenylate cyclase [Proteobacteria bacterium SG_bin9]|nr:MAG: adenylate cyclase [Proteobacteria bacterium SG_bin9]
MNSSALDRFYGAIPVFRGFTTLMDPAHYVPLPDDWLIGVADIVDSTKAIADRRYKAVNMAGAAIIASVTNNLAGREFPFVFGGDGASFAISPDEEATARDALAATAAWVGEDLDLKMRVALVPVAAIRAQGLDVRVARYAPSDNLSYAMFSGGGLGWAEAAMKRGDFAVRPAPAGTHPDLTGLSCRFEEMPAALGLILSLLILPTPGADPAAFRKLIEDVVALVDKSPNAGRPVPEAGPEFRWPPQGMDYEVRAARGGSLWARRMRVFVDTTIAFVFLKFGLKTGNFVPSVYLRQVVENSDFRKYDDGLRMIIDCTPQLAETLEKRLAAAAAEGVVRFGMHRQDAAMMTCFTPSIQRSDHVHFIDGARGGYASAATAMKAMLPRAA